MEHMFLILRFFGPMPLRILFNTQTMQINSIIHNIIATYVFPKTALPWRDWSPGLLFLRLVRHAVKAY
jgi:hypothetical protein